MKIRGKEVNVKNSDKYTFKLGTVNNKDPRCVYLEIKGWIAPTKTEELDYDKIVSRLNKRTKTKLYEFMNTTSNFNKDVYLLDFDLRESGIRHGKRSFYNCEISLYQDKDPKALDELTDEINKLQNKIIDEVFEPFEYFTFHKKKK